MPRRAPYHGVKRRLVLAFDLGTTFSGISYAVLDPGQVPVIKTVSRYPGQEAGDSKVQTVIHYDAKGKVVAIGAEELLVDDEWQDAQPQKLEWFKLLLRPKQPATTTTKGIPTPRLPPSKDIIDVYADFYAYLFARAREYIQQTHANGDLLWDSVADDVDFVLSHPNGWEGAQQGAMRRAAVKAGLVPDTPAGRERVTFVSEGEASFHYCVASGLVADSIQTGNNVMVIDAGGGTVDLSTYTFAEASPIKIQEIAPPGCIFEGSVIVRHRAEQHLQQRLRNSKYGGKSYVDAMTDEFDRATKKRFKPGVGDSYVKFSNSTVDRDVKLGIRNGQIKLSKEEVCGFFDPGIEEIIRAIEEQQDAAAPASISTYFLVGGFAASEYLYAKLNAFLSSRGSRLFRPDSHTNKAVAEGAVSFHIDHFVQTRVAKLTYGVQCETPFIPGNHKHEARRSNMTIGLDGSRRIGAAFSSILTKGTQVSETKEFKRYYGWTGKTPLREIDLNILGYHGNKPPQFTDEEPDSLSTLCEISADVSGLPYAIGVGPEGTYYRQRLSVALSLGLTELKAQIVWEENGIERRGPASVVYDDDFAVTVEG